jgi:hypothetical protein
MSEYQVHEWQAVDRALTPAEQAAVNDLSSHIDVTPSRAVVTYNWSSFRHDPNQVLLQYFDAYFYLANWGTLELMFRFPKGLLDQAGIEPYCIDECVILETLGNYQVLDLGFGPDAGDGWMAGDADLSHFVRLRTDLLEGDYRLLYLAWLKAMTSPGDRYVDIGLYDEDEDPDSAALVREPPVPPGLKQLSSSLQSFVWVFEIDPFLVQAAAEASPDLKPAEMVDYRQLIERLPRAECDHFLARLAEGDAAVGLALRKRLGAFLPPEPPRPSGQRTVDQLLQRAEQLQQAERERQAQLAHEKHIAEMKALAGREKQVWRQVETLLDTGPKSAPVYDQATAMLIKLEQLSQFQDRQAAFAARLRQLAQKYSSRPALIGRWQKRGWI